MSEAMEIGSPPGFLSGGGEMGERMRATDWSATPLGPLEQWPQSLRTFVSGCLNCAFPILVWWGPALVKLYNDAYAAILGDKHPAALGRPGREVWPEIWPTIGPMLDGVMQRGEPTRARDLLLPMRRHAYLEETYFDFSYSPIRDESGGVSGVFCPVVETTERVIAERRTRLLRDIAQEAAEAKTVEGFASAALAHLESGGRLDFFFSLLLLTGPDGTLRIFERTDGVPAASQTVRWPVEQALALGRPVSADACLSTRPPEWSWAEPARTALTLPLGGGSGRPLGVLVLGLSPHRPEPELVRAAELVAAQIASGLANADAYQAELKRAAALAELDRAKTIFFSNISHELRTPLTLIGGPIGDLLDTAPAESRPALQIAHRNARRLQKLVDTLLEFSRLEAGRLQARYVPTDFATLTRELAATFQSAIERAGLAFEVTAEPLAEPVYLDRDMWEKIVLNLLSNALKFTFQGAIRVEIGCSPLGASVRIADTGIGIPEAELPRLFERFHRVESARGRSFEGSGIGLALVAELVQLHGGTIAVQSAPGRGTAFTVSIPFGTSHLPPEHIGSEPDAGGISERANAFVDEAAQWLNDTEAEAEALRDFRPLGPLPARRGAGRVLIADDNADMRSYVGRLVAAAGYEVAFASDGVAALAALRSARPDLLLTDVMMPGLDGLGLLAGIRADPALRDLPVILLSARAAEDARAAAIEAGADDYVVKPFPARELVARIDANVRLAAMRRAAEARLLAQKTILERIATDAPLDTVLDEILLWLEAQEPGSRACLLIQSRNELRFERARGPNLPLAFTQAFEGLVIAPPYTGCCGEATHLGCALSIPDVERDTRYAPTWRALLRSHGLRAVRSMAIRGPSGTVLGSIALYFDEPRDPLPADPSVMEVAASLAAIAIERSHAQARLQEREAFLSLIIESARDYAIITTDTDGRITTWNSGAERMLGLPAAAALGSELAPMLAPLAAPGGDGEPPDAPRRSESRIEGWLRRPDGTALYASGSALPLANGHLRGALTILRDRTIEQTLQQEVESRNRELEAILDAVPVAVWMAGAPDAARATGNRLAAEWVGVRPGQNVSVTAPEAERPDIAVLRHGAFADPWSLPLQRAARGERVADDLLQIRTPDGEVRDVLVSAVPLRDGSGEVTGSVAAATDVTKQMNAERGLRELAETLERRVAETLQEKKLLADLVEGTDAFVMVLDPDYTVLAINRACAREVEQVYGVRPGPGDNLLTLVARPENVEEIRALWDRALAGEAFTVTRAFGDPALGRRHYEVKFNPLLGPGGERIGAYHFVYDVTERVESQRKLAEAQEQLHAMQKLETLGQLTGGIAHDFNNLLTPIVGALDVLRTRASEQDRSLRLISGALQSAERARTLVGRLLSFARRAHLQARPVAVPDLVRGMADLIDRSLGPAIEVRLELPAGLPAAMVDPNQLELALLNLAVNARDAMGAGGQLRIGADRAPALAVQAAGLAPGDYLRIVVADTGVGMSPDTLQRAIEPFFTTKGGRGTGLGLSMVHGLAAQSGGALVLASEPGRGTTATLFLPEAGNAALPESKSGAPAQIAVRPLRILLVDDEPLVRQGMADILAELGHLVLDAASGFAALEQLDRHPEIELLVTDFAMPGMTGANLAREVRRKRPALPVLLVTGYAALDAIRNEDLPRLAKPFSKADLAAAIAGAIGPEAAVPERRLATAKG